MVTTATVKPLLLSHLDERPTHAPTAFADLPSFSKVSAKAAGSYNTWVGHAAESSVLMSLRDATVAIIALDQKLDQPLAKQIQGLTALRNKVDAINTFAGPAGSSMSFWSLRTAMSEYLGKRLAVTAKARNQAELTDGLAKLNQRARQVLNSSASCNSAAASMALVSVRDTLVDYLKQTAAFLR